MPQRVLITGVLGSGGSYLAEHLNSKKDQYHVSGWYRTEHPEVRSLLQKTVVLEQVDMNDFSKVHNLLSQNRYDSIFHIASDANVRRSFDAPRETLLNNISITANLLEALRLTQPETQLLMCSTSEVYGQVLPTEIPIKEDNMIRPASPYSVSKITQDLLSGVYYQAYGLPIIRTRMFTYINPRRADLFATSFALQIAKIEAGQQDALKHGNLESVRTFLDIRDAMNAYELALVKGTSGDVYNIGGTETHTVGEFLELLKSKAHCTIRTELDPNLLRPVDVTLQIPDCSFFREKTGWKPTYSLDQSVDFLLSECRKQITKELNP